MQFRVETLQEAFVFPVKTFAFGCRLFVVAWHDTFFSCHASHLWVFHFSHDHFHGLVVEHGVCVGHDHDVCLYFLDAMVQCGGFSLSFRFERHFHVVVFSQSLVCGVVASVCDPQHVKFFFWIVECVCVLHFFVHDILFVVCAYHDCHVWQFRFSFTVPFLWTHNSFELYQ